MKFFAVLPVLAAVTTVSASACAPKAKTDPTDWAFGTETSTATKTKWAAPLDPSVTGWPGTSEDPAATASAWSYGASDWFATAPGSVLPGSVTSYGDISKPTGVMTNGPPPFQTGGAWSPNSTSDDAKNHPGWPNSADHRGCWGGGFDINTDYEKSWPNTGNVVKYELTVTNTTHAPDGILKEMLLVNGQYPGPLIEANWGDILEITVNNEMKNNGTSFHWHGFRQLNSCPEDGVNGVTECPIAPGDSKTYRFQATSYGTTWYHSHFSLQYGDGVLGPVIIHGPTSANYDIDLGHMILQDSYDLTAYQEDWFAHRFGPPQATNILYNGINIRPDLSSGERFTFTFTPGQKHLIRLINTAIDSVFQFQIDGHTMTVVSNDFVAITPYTTKSLFIGIGQRYMVVVEADQPTANYWMRAIPQQGCSNNVNNGLATANAYIKYEGADSSLPTSNYTAFQNGCQDEPIASLVPIVTKSVDPSGFAAQASALPVGIQRAAVAGEGVVFTWFLNGISLNIDWENPTLQQAVAGNDSFPVERDVITLTEEGAWTFWVIQNQFFVAHPMHLHGHDFSLLGQGNGTFDASTMLDQLNFVNPTRRDVAMLVGSGWTVIAFEVDNPGSWLMHCHIGWHVGEGLALEFLELPAKIPSTYSDVVDSPEYKNTCANWKKYYDNSPAYNKTDSGLKRRTSNGYRPQNHHFDVTRHLHGHARHARRAATYEY